MLYMRKVVVPAGRDAGVLQLESPWRLEDALELEVGPGARAVVVEGCTWPEAAGSRRARIEVRVAPGASLTLIVLQALPGHVDNEVLVRADGGRLIDVSLGGRRVVRRFELGPEAELWAVGGAVEVRGGRLRRWPLPHRPPAAQLDFLRGRGLGEAEARRLLLSGYLEEVMRQIPLEFAVELERLLDLHS